jgi:uncharacterized protein YodC (DUF2158 family)
MKKPIIPIVVALFIITVSATTTIAVDVSNNQIQINSEPSPLGTGYISGIITDSTGNPQENAHVAAFAFGIIGGPAVALSSTASDGSYKCTVPADRYHIISFKFGKGVAFASPVEVKSGQTTQLDLSLTGGLIPGATTTESQTIYSDPVNQQTVTTKTKSIQTIASQQTIPMVYLGTGYISGIITDSTGNPQENAHVAAFAFGIIGGPAVALSSTASDGSYKCTVPADRYHIISFKFGKGVAFASPVEVKSGQTTQLDLSLTGGLIPGATTTESQELTATKQLSPIPTAGTGTITGLITSQNGQPVAFVRVIAVGSPNDPNAQLLGFTVTHLLLGGKGIYTMRVQAGRYLFLRAAKLPFYIGAWAGPVTVGEGETINLDLSITYIGPGSMPESQQSQQIVIKQQSSPTNT